MIFTDSPEHRTIFTKPDFDYDFLAKVNDISDKDLKNALKQGLFLRDIDIYGKEKKYHKHKKDCCYCIHKFGKII